MLLSCLLPRPCCSRDQTSCCPTRLCVNNTNTPEALHVSDHPHNPAAVPDPLPCPKPSCLQPHQDGPLYLPVVAILSLGAPAVLRFWKKQPEGALGRLGAWYTWAGMW
jgi:hypothetical protein